LTKTIGTPPSGNWRGLVERWFGELTNRSLRRSSHRSLRRSSHRSVKALEDDVNAWIAAWNEHPKPFVWTKTADEILTSLARYCTRNNKQLTTQDTSSAASDKVLLGGSAR
jgi:hypothetical protein